MHGEISPSLQVTETHRAEAEYFLPPKNSIKVTEHPTEVIIYFDIIFGIDVLRNLPLLPIKI